MDCFTKIPYDSWSSFKTNVTTDLCHLKSFPYKKFIFRGQADESWGLVSSFDRTYGDLPFETRQKIQKNLISNFKICCRRFESLNLEVCSDVETMTLAQHYGLPTRLLDWSFSIYIAAFFAFSCFSIDPSYIAIWAIDTSHEIWRGDYGVSIHQELIDTNSRQMKQYGLFTLNKSPEKSLEAYVEACSKEYSTDGALFKILIPSSERKVSLNDLDMMGISHCSLLGGIDGCAQSALLQEFLSES